MAIKEVKGRALDPCIQEGTRVILHLTNDANAWGDPCCMAISKKWPQVENLYRKEFTRKHSTIWGLGRVIWEFVDLEIAVANLMCQKGVYGQFNPKPLSKRALSDSLDFLLEGLIGLRGDVNRIHRPLEKVSLHVAPCERDWDTVLRGYEYKLKDFDVYLYKSY